MNAKYKPQDDCKYFLFFNIFIIAHLKRIDD